MFIELYKFSRLVMHLNQCSMDLGRDKFTVKLPFFPTNSPLSSQNIWLGYCPKSPGTCSFYTLRNVAEYKDGCQVIIFYLLRSFYSYGVIC